MSADSFRGGLDEARGTEASSEQPTCRDLDLLSARSFPSKRATTASVPEGKPAAFSIMVQSPGPPTPPVVRLRVGYRSVHALVSAYTASLARERCVLVARKSVAPGARFVFEMFCSQEPNPVLLEGEVEGVRQVDGIPQTYELTIRYQEPEAARGPLETLLGSFEVDTSYHVTREGPRIPVNLPAWDSTNGHTYLVRDVSRGGMRVETTSGECDVAATDRILIGVHPTGRPKVFVAGTVRWVRPPTTKEENQQFGLQFDEFRSASDPRRITIHELAHLRRPQRVHLHIVGAMHLKTAKPPLGEA